MTSAPWRDGSCGSASLLIMGPMTTPSRPLPTPVLSRPELRALISRSRTFAGQPLVPALKPTGAAQ